MYEERVLDDTITAIATSYVNSKEGKHIVDDYLNDLPDSDDIEYPPTRTKDTISDMLKDCLENNLIIEDEVDEIYLKLVKAGIII